MTIFNLPDNLVKYNFWNQLSDLKFIKRIYLFGSRARNDNSNLSDIDIAIELFNNDNNSINWEIILDIIDSADTLLKIDVINITTDNNNNTNQLNVKLLNNIKKYSKVILDRE